MTLDIGKGGDRWDGKKETKVAEIHKSKKEVEGI